MGEDRDILIEMRSDMKHVRESVDHLRQSDAKQWEKLDALGIKTEGHDKTLSTLTWVARGGVTGMMALAWAWLKGDGPK